MLTEIKLLVISENPNSILNFLLVLIKNMYKSYFVRVTKFSSVFLLVFALFFTSVNAYPLSQQTDSSSVSGTPYGDVFTELENVTSGNLGSITIKYDIRSGTNVPVRVILYGYTDNTRSTLCTSGSAGTSNWGGSMRITHSGREIGTYIDTFDFSSFGATLDSSCSYWIYIYVSSGDSAPSKMKVYGTGDGTSGRVLFDNQNATKLYLDQVFYILDTEAIPTSTPLYVYDDIRFNTTWNTPQVRVISGNLSIDPGITLSVASGTIIKFDTARSSSITVNGVLNLDGKENNSFFRNIFLTSLRDDLIGNDTNEDLSSTSPNVGDWGGIFINSGGIANIKHTILRYGGLGTYGSQIYNNGGQVNISTSTITKSFNYGIRNESGTTTIVASDVSLNSYGLYLNGGYASINASSTIHSNGLFGIFNNIFTPIDAENNWWATTTGPYDAFNNPLGGGDNISGQINFTPWIGQIHYLINPNCHTGDDCGSVRLGDLVWGGSTVYSTEFSSAVNIWNAESKVNIVNATSSYKTLDVSDVWDDSSFIKGVWNPEVTLPDSLYLNTYYLNDNSGDERENTIIHELGHGVGLNHSYTNNVMFPYQTSKKTLGTQDKSDFHYLWP